MNSDNQIIHYIGNELIFEIDLIGYKKMGESIVLSVYTKEDGVLWCGVVDSYYQNKKAIRMTEEIIFEKGYGDGRPLDFACLSHFHEDHAKGFDDIIKNFTDASCTSILTIKYSDERGTGKNIKSIRKRIHEKYRRRKIALKNDRLFYNKTLNEGNLRWRFYGPQQESIDLAIDALLPTNSLVEHYDKSKMTGHNENDISVLLKISYSDKIFLFTGDCSDDVLKTVKNESIFNKKYKSRRADISYLKIPHHASQYSEDLINRLEAGEMIVDGATTCAFNESATNQEMLERYKKAVNKLYCTRSIGTITAPYDYGLVKCYFDPNGRLINGEIFKNAIIV